MVVGEKFCGTVSTDVTLDKWKGYSQDVKVRVDKEDVLNKMGITQSQLKEANITIVPLMNDGSEGVNRTNGVFGGWFDENGEPYDWGHGHVYIEVFSDLWNWECGVHPNNCNHEGHTVVMQIQYPHNGTLMKVNVEVNFTISYGGWW